jgi:hypothetical protein
MKNLILSLSCVLLALACRGSAQCPAESLSFSPILYAGPSEVQFTSCDSGADSPRVFPINATTFDWWYFDAVSDDGTQALTVIFFTSSFLGFSFDLLNAIDPLNVYIFANTGSGTPISFPVAATSVTIDTVGDGASGDWVGSGISFQGAPDLSTYTLTFDKTLLNLGIEGTFTLKTVSATAPSPIALECRELTRNKLSAGQGTTFVVPWREASRRKCYLMSAG